MLCSQFVFIHFAQLDFSISRKRMRPAQICSSNPQQRSRRMSSDPFTIIIIFIIFLIISVVMVDDPFTASSSSQWLPFIKIQHSIWSLWLAALAAHLCLLTTTDERTRHTLAARSRSWGWGWVDTSFVLSDVHFEFPITHFTSCSEQKLAENFISFFPPLTYFQSSIFVAFQQRIKQIKQAARFLDTWFFVNFVQKHRFCNWYKHLQI